MVKYSQEIRKRKPNLAVVFAFRRKRCFLRVFAVSAVVATFFITEEEKVADQNNGEGGSSEAERRAQFEAWKASGLSVRAFCKREGIGLNGFRYWKEKLEAGGRTSSMVKVPMRLTHLLPSIEVVVSGRFTIRVPAGFRANDLIRLIEVLEGLS